MTPYVKVPLWVYHAMETGRITHEQLDVLNFAYYKANWATLVVSSYSAENLCRFLRLDATDANLKRYQRAERDLEHQGVVRDDYRRGDKRPFHLTLPPAETENIESLYIHPIVVDSVVDSVAGDVADATDATHTESGQYPATSTELVAADVAGDVAEKGDMMSLKEQEHPKPAEKEPLNPLRGLLPPPPPPAGERSSAAGLESQKRTGKPAGKNDPLNAKQCAQLHDTALLYADFSVWLYHFSPDVDHTEALLRDFKPVELLFAQAERFAPYTNFPRREMAQFFYKSARPTIEAARLKGNSTLISKNLEMHFSGDHQKEYRNEFQHRWGIVMAAWKKVHVNQNAIAEEPQSNCTADAAPVGAGEKS